MLVWCEGFDQWKVLGDVVEELQLQNLINVIGNFGSGFDLWGDYIVIENGIVLLLGIGGGIYLLYSVLVSIGSYVGVGVVQGGEVVYVGFWKWYVVYFIDYVVLIFCGVVIGGIVGVIFGLVVGVMVGLDVGLSILDIVGGLFGIVILLVYYVEFYVLAGGVMLGKMVVGIKVVCSDGQCLICGCVVGCYFVIFVSILILMIGYLMVVFIECKQVLYDLMCDMVVVDKWVFIENVYL